MILLVALESENFPAQRRALREAGPAADGRLGSSVVPPRALRQAAGGAILVVDAAAGVVRARADVPTPSGLAWPEVDGPLYVACQEPCEIRAIDPATGRSLGAWTHPAFNDLHRLVARPGGGVVVAASGADAVVALDADGREAWSWWASPDADRARWRAGEEIPTLSRAVHPISVAALGPDRALVTSFHLGTIAEVGGDGRAELRRSGLRQPHGLVRGDEGWWVADTGRGRILRLDEAFSRAELVSEGHRWLQDLAPTPDGGLWVVENKDFRGGLNDSGGPRVLELDARGRLRWRLDLDPDWRLAAVLPLDAARAARLGWPERRIRARYSTSPPAGTGPA